MFRTWIIRQCNTVWVCKLADIVTSPWLEIIKLQKELFNVILLYGTILEYHIWNKWKCMSINKWLTLISYQCMKKGSSQQQQIRQISTVNLISTLHWCPIGSYSSDDPQEKNLKLSLWATSDKGRTVLMVNCGRTVLMVNCENWQRVLRNSVCN